MSTDSSSGQQAGYTIPGIAQSDADTLVTLLQDRLHALNDLALTLKHIHWNVVGTHFIAVHTMLDPQVEAVRLMVAARSWDDYSLGRATALEHLAALDLVYAGVIESHRKAIQASEEPDPVSQDMLIGQARLLEQYQWFVRAHLETADGRLTTRGAHTEQEAADSAPADTVQKSAQDAAAQESGQE
jgi:starvation-inducible DNA-binding protein